MYAKIKKATEMANKGMYILGAVVLAVKVFDKK